MSPPKDPTVDGLIVPPRYTSRLTGESFEKNDPRLQQAALLRRGQADAIRARASRVETGEIKTLPVQGIRRA